MQSVCYQFVIEWDQVRNYMQSVCNNRANVLPSPYTEIYITYAQSPARAS